MKSESSFGNLLRPAQGAHSETVFANSPVTLCRGLVPASNKEPHGRSLTPPLQRNAEENWKKNVKLVVWDKDSLTEQ